LVLGSNRIEQCIASSTVFTVDAVASLPKLEAVRFVLQGECPRRGKGLDVVIGMKVSQRENPRIQPEEVASISKHGSSRVLVNESAVLPIAA
jgi:hypothetical protein